MLPDRDVQPGADLGVRHGQVIDQQGDQLLAARRQAGGYLTRRGAQLSCQQQLLLRHPVCSSGMVRVASTYPAGCASWWCVHDMDASRRVVAS